MIRPLLQRAWTAAPASLFPAGNARTLRAEELFAQSEEPRGPVALPRRRNLRATLTRAVFPRVMEFKVISREPEKHEFMPVVYLVDRSPVWRRRVPATVERAIVEEYVAPLVQPAPADGFTAAPLSPEAERRLKLALVERELAKRARLVDEADPDASCADERAYKMGVLVDFAVGRDADASASAREQSELYQVTAQLLSTLRQAPYRRALIVPVAVHYCSDGRFLNVRRFAGIRYGAPVLVEDADMRIYVEDPTEFTHFVSARLASSLKMVVPTTATQLEVMRLTRTLHVFCCNVVRDDCFSRRQLASMNEEILQIHFRTRNHPDMHQLKSTMAKYWATLKKWKLRDEDVNSATALSVEDLPKHPLHFVWLVLSIFELIAGTPMHLLLSGACDVVYRLQQPMPNSKSGRIDVTLLSSGAVKFCLAFLMVGVFLRIALMSGPFGTLLLMVVLALPAMNLPRISARFSDMTQHWKKIQFYLMDPEEWAYLRDTRAVLARSIHAIVAQYVSTDLPPPVLQDKSKSPTSVDSPTANLTTPADADPALLGNDEYTLNAHHKIFINTPRSFPLAFATTMTDRERARRVVYAPKMLRDELWRSIYEALAPGHLRFSALLADNKGDNIPMEMLLHTPFFSAVLSAYIIYQTRPKPLDGVDDGVALWTDDIARAADDGHFDCCASRQSVVEDADFQQQQLGGYASVREIMEAALQMALDEEEASA